MTAENELIAFREKEKARIAATAGLNEILEKAALDGSEETTAEVLASAWGWLADYDAPALDVVTRRAIMRAAELVLRERTQALRDRRQ